MANREFDWFKFEARTWLTDLEVQTMSLECQGAYVRLLCVQWENGFIPLDPPDIALVLGFHSVDEGTRFLAAVWPKLKAHFRRCRPQNGRQNQKLASQRVAAMRKLDGAKAGGRIRGEQQTLAKAAAAQRQLNGSLTPADGDGDGEKKSKSVPNKVRHKYTESFTQFWEAYPKRKGRKRGKDQVFSAWRKLPWEFQQEILVATRNYAASEDVREGFARDPVRFIKDNWWREWVEPPERVASEYDTLLENLRNRDAGASAGGQTAGGVSH